MALLCFMICCVLWPFVGCIHWEWMNESSQRTTWVIPGHPIVLPGVRISLTNLITYISFHLEARHKILCHVLFVFRPDFEISSEYKKQILTYIQLLTSDGGQMMTNSHLSHSIHHKLDSFLNIIKSICPIIISHLLPCKCSWDSHRSPSSLLSDLRLL